MLHDGYPDYMDLFCLKLSNISLITIVGDLAYKNYIEMFSLYGRSMIYVTICSKVNIWIQI